MHDQRVLITGGAGLVGSTLADALVKEGVREIIVLDNLSHGRVDNLAWALSNGPVSLVEGDIRDRRLLAEVMRGVDVVFHQAGLPITRCGEEPRLALEVLADGTFNVLEAAVRADVWKVVAASSASVYGLAEELPIHEDHHPYNNVTLQGAAKAFNEGMLRSFHEMYGIECVALRYFNVYGPRMTRNSSHSELLIGWMERIASGQPPLVKGDGSHTRDFVHVEDVARANVLAVRSVVCDEVVNVASGVDISLNDLVGMLLRVMGSPLEPQCVQGPDASAVPRQRADVAKARRLLGFEAQVGLEEGLEGPVDWWLGRESSIGLAAV